MQRLEDGSIHGVEEPVGVSARPKQQQQLSPFFFVREDLVDGGLVFDESNVAAEVWGSSSRHGVDESPVLESMQQSLLEAPYPGLSD